MLWTANLLPSKPFVAISLLLTAIDLPTFLVPSSPFDASSFDLEDNLFTFDDQSPEDSSVIVKRRLGGI